MQTKTTIELSLDKFNMAVMKSYIFKKSMLEEVGRKENLYTHTVFKEH